LSSPKLKPESEEILDLPADREQGLSSGFEDPAIAEILPELGDELLEPGIVSEAAEAVHELMVDAGAGSLESTPATPFLLEESRRETAALASKAQLAERLFSLVACNLSFPDLVEGILQAFVQAIGAEAGSILELDRTANEFFFRASIGGGDPENVKAFRVPANKGIVGHVAESRQPLLLRDLASDEKQLRAISMSSGLEAKSCLAAPIVLDNQIYGVIELFNKVPGECFDERDLEVIEEGVIMAAKVLEVRFLAAELARRTG
jgi:transcriptional regulator with GAF, ATPase, and Fis domain